MSKKEKVRQEIIAENEKVHFKNFDYRNAFLISFGVIISNLTITSFTSKIAFVSGCLSLIFQFSEIVLIHSMFGDRENEFSKGLADLCSKFAEIFVFITLVLLIVVKLGVKL